MSIQIANPEVIKKIERLATSLKTSKTGAVERALDAYQLNFLSQNDQAEKKRKADEFIRNTMAILAQFDALPLANPDAPNDLEWDENGLPV